MAKNIDIPVLKQRIIWTAIMSVIAILFVMSVQRKINAEVSSVAVKIKPLTGNRNLISDKEVVNLFTKFVGYEINKANIKNVDINELEELLRADKRVKKVEVFVDSDDKLNVWIVQKQPIVRIMDGSNKSYYLDEEGSQIPVVNKSAVRVPLATGHFELYQEGILSSEKPSRLKEVFKLSKGLVNDSFLSALIEQIDVNDNGEMVMIPKIGRQVILVGDASNLDEKFENLKLMYRDGLPREGWKKYNVLKINYRGVVYATKVNNELLN